MTMRLLINLLFFQIGWFLAILTQSPWSVAWALLFLWVHYQYFAIPGEMKCVLPVIALGFVIDSLWQLSPWILFLGAAPVDLLTLPYWMLALWIMFPLTLLHSLHWLQGRYYLQIILGVVGAGGSYVAGARLGAAEVNTVALFMIAGAWGLWLPLMYCWLQKRVGLQKSVVYKNKS